MDFFFDLILFEWIFFFDLILFEYALPAVAQRSLSLSLVVPTSN